MALGRLERALRGKQVAGDIGRHDTANRGAAGSGQGPEDRGLVALPDAVEGTEEPDFVLDGEAADVNPVVGAMRRVHRRGLGLRQQRRRLVVCLERAALTEAEQVSVKHVTARLGDDVHGTAGHPAVLGAEAAGLNFDFLDEIEVQGLSLHAGFNAGRVQAVDDVLIFGTRRSIERRPVRVLRDAGGEARNRVEVATHRQLIEDIFVGDDTARRACRVDHRGHPRDVDRLGHALDLHGHGERDRLVHSNPHVRSLGHPEPGELGFDQVDAWRQGWKAELTGFVGDDGIDALQIRAGDRDRDAGQHRALSVGNGSNYAACSLGNCQM